VSVTETCTPSPPGLDVLSQTDFFAGLAAQQLEALSFISQLEEYEEGAQIYNHGEPAKYFYVLVEGLVKFAIGFGARTSAGDILRRGKVFGWAALTPGTKRRIATASCVTPCTVLALDGDACMELMQRDHTLGFMLMMRLNVLITSTLTTFAAG
jgi:CRP/FNR family transcriptional regulator, cyclic AMP receptor protein